MISLWTPSLEQQPTVRRELKTKSFSLRCKGLDPTKGLDPQLLRLAPERWAPKHYLWKPTGAWVHKTHKTIKTEELLWNSLHTDPPAPRPSREAALWGMLRLFPGKALLFVLELQLEGQASGLKHTSRLAGVLFGDGDWWAPSLHFILCLAPACGCRFPEGTFTYIWCPSLRSCHPKDAPWSGSGGNFPLVNKESKLRKIHNCPRSQS